MMTTGKWLSLNGVANVIAHDAISDVIYGIDKRGQYVMSVNKGVSWIRTTDEAAQQILASQNGVTKQTELPYTEQMCTDDAETNYSNYGLYSPLMSRYFSVHYNGIVWGLTKDSMTNELIRWGANWENCL